MTPAAIIAQADADGVTLALTQTGTIKASGEPAIINRWLPIIRQHKPALLAHLRRNPEPQDIIADPDGPCSKCDGGQWWQLPGQPWHCRRCCQMTGADRRCATTLTLPSHTLEPRPIRNLERIDGLLAEACRGLAITPQQLHAELIDDLDDIESGALSADGLRLTAETLAESLPDPKTAKALALLAANPETKYALVSDEETDADNVILTLALRDEATCALKIPRTKYDGLKVLELLAEGDKS